MTLPFFINGARAVIPGVYDSLRVEDALAPIAATGRSVLIIGEAEAGIPSKDLDIKLNYFESYQDVKAYYKKGAIVDAARQLFTSQPAAVFGGAIERLYIYKTNDTTRAERLLSNGYGRLVAAVFEEKGNLIKTQVRTAQQEMKPSISVSYLPSLSPQDYLVSVNGVVYTAGVDAFDASTDVGSPFDFASVLNALTGVAASGGARRFTTGADITVSSTVAGVIELSSVNEFSTAIQSGDILVIAPSSALAGSGNANCGVFVVESASNQLIKANRIKAWGASSEVVPSAIVPLSDITCVADDFVVYSPVSVSVNATTLAGQGASLELSNSIRGVGDIFGSSWSNAPLSADASAIGSLKVSVVSANRIKIDISKTSFSRVLNAGDVIQISESSIIKGTSNAGLWTVVTASAQSITLESVYGLSGSVTSVIPIAGSASTFKVHSGFVASTIAGNKIVSASERTVWVDASQVDTGSRFPSSAIGGKVMLELSFNDGVATSASVSINERKRLVLTTSETSMEWILAKYDRLEDLVVVLNTVNGLSARIPDARMKSFVPSNLDMVSSVGIMGASSVHSFVGRIKADYWSWKDFFDANFGLLAFAEGSMLLKAGLPVAESVPMFLSGADIGSSSNADFASAMDEALKISVRNVIPLVSRDARFDIEDGTTDEDSSYTVDAINAALKAHISTASSTLIGKRRFGMASFHGSFADSIQKCAELSFERMQMSFEMVRSTNGEGNLVWFLPWMLNCAVVAGRSQAIGGTSMLRKPFNISAVKHIGNESIYSDTLAQDFDPEDPAKLATAIEAGLLVAKAVPGFGVRMESPDLTTRSRTNDPQGWVWERANVLFAIDEFREVLSSVLDAYIGARTSDVSTAEIAVAVSNVIRDFTRAGVLIQGSVIDVKSEGNGYRVFTEVFPPEALEFIGVDILARRSVE